MSGEIIVSGPIIYGDGLELKEGYVVVSGSKIKEVGFERCDSDLKGLICPAFINAHTHVGDSIAKDLPYMPLVELVAPPDGLKHRLLNAASSDEVSASIRSTLDVMRRMGTSHFVDFRENGAAGARLLRKAAGGKATVLGRLAPGDTIEDVLATSDGFGISCSTDVPGDVLQAVVEKAKNSHKIVGIHAGELNRKDIKTAIDIMPDFLVHMTQAIVPDLKRMADLDMPVVVCPRSNVMTGVGLPPIKRMREAGIRLALGTDNVMLNAPDMFREMEWASKLFLHDDTYTLQMATINAARIARLDREKGSILPGKDADLLVFDTNSDTFKCSQNLLSTVVRRTGPDDLNYFMEEGNIWQNSLRRS